MKLLVSDICDLVALKKKYVLLDKSTAKSYCLEITFDSLLGFTYAYFTHLFFAIEICAKDNFQYFN